MFVKVLQALKAFPSCLKVEWRSDFPTQRRNPMVFQTNAQIFGEVWWLQQNFGIFSTRQGTGIWHYDLEVKSSSKDIKLRHVIGFSLMFLEEQAARGSGLTKDWSPWRWKPWKPVKGLSNFAFYHPFLSSNMLHHVGSVLRALKAFLSCLKVEGSTFPLSAPIPWSSKQTCKFSATSDGCNRILAAFWHGRDLESDTSMRKTNHPVKTLNFGMSSDSLWCFFGTTSCHADLPTAPKMSG